MVFKALEVRSNNGLVTAQVALEDGENHDEAVATLQNWVEERALAQAPPPEPIPEPIDEAALRSEIEAQVKKTWGQRLIEHLNRPDDILMNKVFENSGPIYGEPTTRTPLDANLEPITYPDPQAAGAVPPTEPTTTENN